MALTLNTAEGGTPTNAVDTSSIAASGTAWSVVTPGAGGTITYTADAYYKGKVAVALTAASGVQNFVERSIAGARSGSFTCYIKFGTLPNAGQIFLAARNSGGSVISALAMTATTGTVYTSSAAGTAGTPTATGVTTGVWYRLEWSWTNPTTTTGTSTVDFYLGDSTVPVSGMSLADTGMNNGTSNSAILRIGKQSTTGTFGTITIDDIAYNDGTTTPPGSSTLPSPDAYMVATRGTTANTTSGTSTTVSLAAGASITTSNYLIARVAVDNNGTNGAAPGLTVSDAKNGSWTVLGPALADPGAAAAGATCYIAYVKATVAYANNDNVTFTWGTSVDAKAIVIEEWSNIHLTSPIAVSATTASGTATPLATSSITPTAAGQLVYVAAAMEGPWGDGFTLDSDTTDGSWAALLEMASDNTTAVSNQAVYGACKRVTGTTAQVFNSTITSRDWAALAVVFDPIPPPVEPDPLPTPSGFTFVAASGSRSITASWVGVSGADHYLLEVEIASVAATPTWSSFGDFQTTESGYTIDETDGVDWSRTYRGRVTAIAPVV